MTRPRRSLWLLAVVGSVLGACSGDDSSPTGTGGSPAAGGTGGAGGAGGAAGSTETGGSGGATSGGAGGTAGSGGASGTAGTGGSPDAGFGGKGGTGGQGDAATGGPPLIDGGRCVAPGTLAVTADGSMGYLIAGSALNPSLTLCRGMTYTFAINAAGHPFFLRRGMDDYNDGVTGNHTAVGNLVFTVPMTAPDLLFYECAAHSWMQGPVHIVN